MKSNRLAAPAGFANIRCAFCQTANTSVTSGT
ncbi:MAG: hypothetical protein KDE67_10690 [Sphingobium sp.]|nr:hypothetical protein [Sphingobium sp.]MCP5397706.1 hypothetical protein [Sphingomonas sp.]